MDENTWEQLAPVPERPAAPVITSASTKPPSPFLDPSKMPVPFEYLVGMAACFGDVLDAPCFQEDELDDTIPDEMIDQAIDDFYGGCAGRHTRRQPLHLICFPIHSTHQPEKRGSCHPERLQSNWPTL